MRYEEIKVPGIYAIVEENTLAASAVEDVGKTPTIICDAPDFIFVADSVYGGTTGVKPVRVDDNVIYVIGNPKEFLQTLRGEIFAEGSLTQEQLDAMRCPLLENALEIAIRTNKKFAFVKMVKRDGNRPDMNNMLEVYQAHEYTTESLSVINVGKVVPFGFSVQDVFELNAAETESSLVVKTKVGSYAGYASSIFPNKYTLDIERDIEGSVLLKIEDHGAIGTDSIPTDIQATVVYRDSLGVEKTVKTGLAVEYKGAFDFNGTPVKAIVLSENQILSVLPGEIDLAFNKGTLVAIIAAEADGTLIRNAGGELVLNYDVVNVATPDATTPSGPSQGFIFQAAVTRNPFVNVSSIVEPGYDSKIQILQGVNNTTGAKNFAPTTADSYVLTFAINGAKTTADVYKHLDERKTKIGTIDVEVSGTDPKVLVAKIENELALEETGLTVIIPAGLKVYNEAAVFDTKLGDSIFFNVTYEVKNQPSYKIDVVPSGAAFVKLYSEFPHKLTFELDETVVVLSAGLIASDANIDKEAYVGKLEKLGIRGSLLKQLTASNVQDLGKYLTVVTGAAKSPDGIGGYKALYQIRISDFGRTNGGAGEIEALTNTVIIPDGSTLRKGDSVEISTIKRKKPFSMKTFVEKVTKLIDGTYSVTLTNKVDTAVFDKNLFEVTLSVTNKKDFLGNYAAFQYAIFSDTVENNAPVRKYMEGTAEVTFTKDLIKRLDAAGYTVLNNDPNSTGIIVENTPTMASETSQFANQAAVGTIFWVMRKLRKIGRNYQGQNMNNPENQSSYADRCKELEKEAKAAYIVTSLTITPKFSNAASGKISARFNAKIAELLKEIVYYSQIDQ